MIYLFFLFAFFLLGVIFYFVFSRHQKKMEQKLYESFKAISFDVLQKSSSTLVDQAKSSLSGFQESAKTDLDYRKKEIEHLLSPIKEAMGKLEKQSSELERKREEAYFGLKSQLTTLAQSEKELTKQTHQLSKALKSPNIRGMWGQVHLKRVVELAGLLNHCDFTEQTSVDTGVKILRPDLVVQLPGDRKIIVDAKTPLDAYLEAVEEPNETLYLEKLTHHAKNIKRHVKELAGKEYFKGIKGSVEYVILFLPAEAFFSSALKADPLLIETGAFQNVIIATPTTLLAILKSVELSWKQEAISKNAEEIACLGKELYERIATLSDHWAKVGKNLSQALDSYNSATSSLESRVLSSARKFTSLGAGTHKSIRDTELLEKLPKSFRSEELLKKQSISLEAKSK